MANPKTTHIGDPKTTPHIDHYLRVRSVDNIHKYEMLCTTCNKHIKWASETEFRWSKSRKTPIKFRTLWWAPRYDVDYQNMQDWLDREKRSVKDIV